MLILPCPCCGPRSHDEFTYYGDASVTRPAPDAEVSAFYAFLHTRENPRGRHKELWHHTAGCRQWLIVERDTLTHEVLGAELARKPAVSSVEPVA